MYGHSFGVPAFATEAAVVTWTKLGDEFPAEARNLTSDEFRTHVPPGRYVCKTDCTIFLAHGTGDARRDVAYVRHLAGATIEIPRASNGYWYGLDPNGSLFSPALAVLVVSGERVVPEDFPGEYSWAQSGPRVLHEITHDDAVETGE